MGRSPKFDLYFDRPGIEGNGVMCRVAVIDGASREIGDVRLAGMGFRLVVNHRARERRAAMAPFSSTDVADMVAAKAVVGDKHELGHYLKLRCYRQPDFHSNRAE
jgi:hypothetical protein